MDGYASWINHSSTIHVGPLTDNLCYQEKKQTLLENKYTWIVTCEKKKMIVTCIHVERKITDRGFFRRDSIGKFSYHEILCYFCSGEISEQIIFNSYHVLHDRLLLLLVPKIGLRRVSVMLGHLRFLSLGHFKTSRGT